MKGNPLEGGYKGFFMEESLRRAGSSNVPTSRNIDQLKKECPKGSKGRPESPLKKNNQKNLSSEEGRCEKQ